MCRKIFISHPFSGDEDENVKKAGEICKNIIDKGVIISPLHSLRFLNDANHREYALNWCKEMIKMCDEVWFYGDSEGCLQEMEWAKEMGKVCKCMM